jgi:hypothetical protein
MWIWFVFTAIHVLNMVKAALINEYGWVLWSLAMTLLALYFAYESYQKRKKWDAAHAD